MVAYEDGHRRVRPRLDDRDPEATVEWLGRLVGFTERTCFGRGDDDVTASLERPDGATVMASGLGDESKGWMHGLAARFEEVFGPNRPLPTHAVTLGVDQAEGHHRRLEGERHVLLSVRAYQPWGLRSSAAVASEGHQWELARITSDGRNRGGAASAIDRRSPWEVPGGRA